MWDKSNLFQRPVEDTFSQAVYKFTLGGEAYLVWFALPRPGCTPEEIPEIQGPHGVDLQVVFDPDEVQNHAKGLRCPNGTHPSLEALINFYAQAKRFDGYDNPTNSEALEIFLKTITYPP